jgi:hypothetical protein
VSRGKNRQKNFRSRQELTRATLGDRYRTWLAPGWHGERGPSEILLAWIFEECQVDQLRTHFPTRVRLHRTEGQVLPVSENRTALASEFSTFGDYPYLEAQQDA